MRYKRQQVGEILSLLSGPPVRMIFVTGPRQAGKTTLVRQALAEIPPSKRGYIPVDEPGLDALPTFPIRIQPAQGPSAETVNTLGGKPSTRWIRELWEQAREQANRSEDGFVLVFDEIQQIPDWSPTVKGLWDRDRIDGTPLHVILLGSAPLLMQKGMAKESMTGRYMTVHVPHWSFTEMRDAFGFSLEQYVYFGGYPGSASYIHEQSMWRQFVADSIIEPNIERDILAMEQIKHPALLKLLFELGVEYSGRIMSYTKMLGELRGKGHTTTLIRYLDLLSKSNLVTGLEKYSNAPHLQKQSSPKLNVLNTAFIPILSGYAFEEAQADRTFWGRLVESAVGAHLHNTKNHTSKLYYWREADYEVDFVLKRGPRLIAVEVKSGRKRSYPPGLQKFKKRFENVSSILVGTGGMPVSEFLSIPACDLPEDL